MEMELTVFSHTILALAALYGAYVWGKHNFTENMAAEVITGMLAALEKEGLIKTVMDKDGEKEILKPLTWEKFSG